MKMKTLKGSLTAVLVSGLLAGCFGSNGADPVVRDIPRDEAWRTINVNLHEVSPEWDAANPFPEDPLSPPPSMTGCATGKNSLATGPPWSLRVEQTLLEPTPSEVQDIERGFAALERRGYSAVKKPSGSPANRKVANDSGYFVLLRVDATADGTQTYELISVSSCIRFEGDDQYS